MKPPYFEFTFSASCIAATLGAGYTTVVANLLMPGRLGLAENLAVLIITLLLSLPFLLAGSAILGWVVTKFLYERFPMNRLLIFSMTGMLMGLLGAAGIALLGTIGFPVAWFARPRGLGEWLDAALIGSIPVFFMTVAGHVAGLHATLGERTPPPGI